MKTVILHFIFVLIFVLQGIAQIQSGSFSYEGYKRSYLVFLPQAYNGIDKLPVVLNFHGDKASVQWLLGYREMNSLADTSGFIVVYPNSKFTNNIGEPSFNYDGDPFIIPDKPDTRDVGFVDVLIDTLEKNYSIDMSRIYATGWSGGGVMCFKLACYLNYRFAALAPVSALLSEVNASNLYNFHNVPLLIMNGTADPIVPFNGSPGWQSIDYTFNYWGNYLGCSFPDTLNYPDTDIYDQTTVKKITYTNCTDVPSVVLYKIINGGHTWPDAAFPRPQDGYTSYDINANKEIWEFFKNYNNPVAHDAIAIAKSVSINKKYVEPQGDSLLIETQIKNEDSHLLNVFAIIEGKTKTHKDSIELFDDGKNGDVQAADNIWSNRKWFSDLTEDNYNINVVTQDNHTNTKHRLFSERNHFTTLGSVEIDTIYSSDTVIYPGDQIRFDVFLKNNGSTDTVRNVSILPVFFNPCTKRGGFTPLPKFGDIGPGEIKKGDNKLRIDFADSCSANSFINFGLRIVSESDTFWTDTFTVFIDSVISGISDNRQILRKYHLYQNYPNPFNPSTTIRYRIPKIANVKLAIYDIAGREIKTLLDSRQNAGSYDIHFDASDLPSGIYFYRLITSAGFEQSRKMLLVK